MLCIFLLFITAEVLFKNYNMAMKPFSLATSSESLLKENIL